MTSPVPPSPPSGAGRKDARPAVSTDFTGAMSAGSVHHRRGRYAAAVRSFTMAMEADETSIAAVVARARSQAMLGQSQLALEDAHRVLAMEAEEARLTGHLTGDQADAAAAELSRSAAAAETPSADEGYDDAHQLLAAAASGASTPLPTTDHHPSPTPQPPSTPPRQQHRRLTGPKVDRTAFHGTLLMADILYAAGNHEQSLRYYARGAALWPHVRQFADGTQRCGDRLRDAMQTGSGRSSPRHHRRPPTSTPSVPVDAIHHSPAAPVGGDDEPILSDDDGGDDDDDDLDVVGGYRAAAQRPSSSMGGGPRQATTASSSSRPKSAGVQRTPYRATIAGLRRGSAKDEDHQGGAGTAFRLGGSGGGDAAAATTAAASSAGGGGDGDVDPRYTIRSHTVMGSGTRHHDTASSTARGEQRSGRTSADYRRGVSFAPSVPKQSSSPVPPTSFRLGVQVDGGDSSSRPPRPSSAGRRPPSGPGAADDRDDGTVAQPPSRQPQHRTGASSSKRSAMPELAVDRAFLQDLAADTRLFDDAKNLNNTPHAAVTKNNHNHPANAAIRPKRTSGRSRRGAGSENAHRAISAAAEWTAEDLDALVEAGLGGGGGRRAGKRGAGAAGGGASAGSSKTAYPTARGQPVPTAGSDLPRRLVNRAASASSRTATTSTTTASSTVGSSPRNVTTTGASLSSPSQHRDDDDGRGELAPTAVAATSSSAALATGDLTGRTLADFRKDVEREAEVERQTKFKVSSASNRRMQALITEAIAFVDKRQVFWEHTDSAIGLPSSIEVEAATRAARREAVLVGRAQSSSASSAGAAASSATPPPHFTSSPRLTTSALSTSRPPAARTSSTTPRPGPPRPPSSASFDAEHLARPTTSSAHRAEMVLANLRQRQAEADEGLEPTHSSQRQTTPRRTSAAAGGYEPQRRPPSSATRMMPVASPSEMHELLDVVRAVTGVDAAADPSIVIRGAVSSFLSPAAGGGGGDSAASPGSRHAAAREQRLRAAGGSSSLSRGKLLERQMLNRFRGSAAERAAMEDATAALAATPAADGAADGIDHPLPSRRHGVGESHYDTEYDTQSDDDDEEGAGKYGSVEAIKREMTIAWGTGGGGGASAGGDGVTLEWARAEPISRASGRHHGSEEDGVVTDEDDDDARATPRQRGQQQQQPHKRRSASPQRLRPHTPTAKDKATLLNVVKAKLTESDLPYEHAMRHGTEVDEVKSGAAFATHSSSVGTSRARVEDAQRMAAEDVRRRPWLQGSVIEPSTMKKHRVRESARAASQLGLSSKSSSRAGSRAAGGGGGVSPADLAIEDSEAAIQPGGAGMGRLREMLDDDDMSATSGTSVATTMTASGTRLAHKQRHRDMVVAHERSIKHEMVRISGMVASGDYPQAITAVRALIDDVASVSQVSIEHPKAHIDIQAKLRILLGELYTHLGDDASSCREYSSAAIVARRAKNTELYEAAVKGLAARYSRGSSAVLVPVAEAASASSPHSRGDARVATSSPGGQGEDEALAAGLATEGHVGGDGAQGSPFADDGGDEAVHEDSRSALLSDEMDGASSRDSLGTPPEVVTESGSDSDDDAAGFAAPVVAAAP